MTDIHIATSLFCLLCIHMWLAVCIVADMRRERDINETIQRGFDRETPQ